MVLTVVRLAKQHLIQVDAACAKGMRRGRHIKLPRPVCDFVSGLDRFRCVLFKTLNPSVQSQSIVLA